MWPPFRIIVPRQETASPCADAPVDGVPSAAWNWQRLNKMPEDLLYLLVDQEVHTDMLLLVMERAATGQWRELFSNVSPPVKP